MSMILDALRKSEAERRRAEVPDLFDEAPVAAAARLAGPSRPWLWAVAAIVVMLAVAAVIAARDTDAVAPDTVEVARPVPTTPATTAAPPALPSAALPTPAMAPAPAPVSATTLPPAALAEPLPGTTVASVPPPAQPTAVVAPPASLPIPPPVSPQAATSAPPPAPTLSTAPRAVAPAVLPPPAPGAPGNTASTTTAPTAAAGTAAFTSPTAPMRLSDLSIDERQQLPALKISMLMWNPASERRFAIVDGNRVAEGDRVGDAVVDAITEDGVVLGWQGRRLKVPIR